MNESCGVGVVCWGSVYRNCDVESIEIMGLLVNTTLKQ